MVLLRSAPSNGLHHRVDDGHCCGTQTHRLDEADRLARPACLGVCRKRGGVAKSARRHPKKLPISSTNMPIFMLVHEHLLVFHDVSGFFEDFMFFEGLPYFNMFIVLHKIPY